MLGTVLSPFHVTSSSLHLTLCRKEKSNQTGTVMTSKQSKLMAVLLLGARPGLKAHVLPSSIPETV